MKRSLFLLIFAGLFFAGTNPEEKQVKIEYEKYKLANGLDVILHIDRSDPIVALAVQYHVGSNRETEGRTGFAHLFEHMMFQRSENVPEDQFFKLIQDAGGMLNGGTSNDATTYFEVVPKNALEKILWMESDRMGFMINTVTKKSFAISRMSSRMKNGRITTTAHTALPRRWWPKTFTRKGIRTTGPSSEKWKIFSTQV